MVEIKKNRIEWIDTAKGLTILLVVLGHTTSINTTFFGVILFTFRMPLYYFLSGLFFKTYNSLGSFLTKKINNLLIPSAFFYLGGCFIYWFLQMMDVPFNVPPISMKDFFLPLYPSESFYCQGVIWFLLSLFEVNIICYFLKKIKLSLALPIIMILALLGYYFSIPYFLDTSLVAIPLFFVGNYMKSLLKNDIEFFKLLLIILCCIAWLIFFSFKVDMKNNYYDGSFLLFYINAFIGIVMILSVSKLLGNVKILSTVIGRYSIVILLTHGLLINPIRWFSNHYLNGNELFVFVSVMMTCGIIVPLFVRFFPYVCAQKNIFETLNSK